ncbi:MAG: hypothetical protein LQ342_007820 [Letrouitia transgressa]|nr:MAG: hypothetical protein LQ342_007820 [Letrouitia transgressa]
MPDTNGVLRSSRHNSDEENRLLTRPAAFGGNDTGFPIQLSRQSTHNSASGFSSSVASRSGSLPPSRNEGDSQLRYDDIHHTTYPNFIQPSTNIMQHQHTLSPQALAFSKVQGVRSSKYGHAGSHASLNSLSEDFGNMKVGKGNKALDTASRESQYGLHNMSPYEYGQAAEAVSTNGAWEVEENNYDQSSEPFGPNFVPAGVIPLHAQHRHSAFNTSAVHTPTSSDNRQSQRSPYYSQGGTPPYGPKSRAPSHSSFNENVPTGQAMLLERKLRGLQQVQQEQQGHMQPQPNPMHFRSALPNNYDFLPQSSLRMNPIHNYYPLAPVPSLLTHVPRGPARGRDLGQNTRSALLEKFKSDSKPQKTWELKDIYEHIIEFSGDQHGSRFIQEKLQTANSDEKDLVFREILPNSMQLMIDVFGNYVIQKFFEHGNQSQKKVLASQMKNHIQALSVSMYGCRVVQKALEHVLVDQQAEMMRELHKNIYDTITNQNGNHVIQKAIERVPAEHIQFIIDEVQGQVLHLSKHQYGCRVIQRMLEHCDKHTRTALLQELHGCAHHLIENVYGNYVTQHVIEHGREEDRARIISLIIGNLIWLSKHKFASNVVERAFKFGTAEQHQQMIDILTMVNENGEGPLQHLVRDMYGNYVIQKALAVIKGPMREKFVEVLRGQIAIAKKYAFGKQVLNVEKVLNATETLGLQPRSNNIPPAPIDTSHSTVPSPPLLTGDAQSPPSSSLPSTSTSSVVGAVNSRKSSGSNDVEVMTPSSAQQERFTNKEIERCP